MKKTICCILTIVMLSAAPAWANEGSNTSGGKSGAEWTVMLYLCGTDLETDGKMATLNLEEIAATKANNKVNVVIQTGGTKTWHAKKTLGLDIASDKMQRYTYDAAGYKLREEGSLPNMAYGQSLTDFVKWSKQNYPAKKYMLVMWDHGGGSNGGLIVDEQYENAAMSVEEMGQALKAAGVLLEALVLDACLMASLETAQAVAPSAKYLIASEEVVDGAGSAYSAWMQYLYDNSSCDGALFGKAFCDFAQQKYAEQGIRESSDMITFSVIDLSKVQAVTKTFARMFTELGQLLQTPDEFRKFAFYSANRAEKYDFPEMIDLVDMASRARGKGLSNETANMVINAVEKAVIYSVKGVSHSYSHGLSFWYNPKAEPAELDRYVRNSSQNPEYLAFLDAASLSWSAPSWVYQDVKRLPERKYEDYIVKTKLQTTSNANRLKLQITNAKKAVAQVDASLYKYDKANKKWINLGMFDQVACDFENGIFKEQFKGKWLKLNNSLCYAEIFQETEKYTLYNIPVLCDIYGDGESIPMMLRAAFVYDVPLDDDSISRNSYAGHYEVYGIWKGADSAIGMASRDVYTIAELEGIPITPLLPTGTLKQKASEELKAGKTITLSEDIVFGPQKLPKGKYAYQFIVKDAFGSLQTSKAVSFSWDGKKSKFNLKKKTAA